jgi:two-component system sensor histidine kinase YesM
MDKITIVTQADDDALEKHIFRLMLQPLVENAILHGMVENIRPGTVSVKIRHLADTQQLEIVTSDDGIGMNEEKLAEVRDILANPKENESIGFSNIVMRLRLFYGDRYRISLESEEGKGTEVKVVIPDHIDVQTHAAEDSDRQGEL